MPTTTYGMGSFSTVVSITGTALTSSYSTPVEIDTHSTESLALLIDYTKGSESGVNVKVEVYDGSTWREVSYLQDSTVTFLKTASGKFRWGIRSLARFETKIRVSAKVSGGSSNATTSLQVRANLKSSRYPISGNVT